MKNSNRTTLFGVLAVLIILGLGYVLAISPAIDSALGARDDLAAEQVNNDKRQIDLADLQQKQKDLPRIQGQAASLAAVFPGTAEQVAVITAVNDAARASGATLVGITPTSPAVGAALAEGIGTEDGATPATDAVGADFPVGTVNLVISANGSNDQIRGFLAGIEQMKYPIIVGNVSLSGSAESDVTEAVITGSMYLTKSLEVPQVAAS